jgi:hypothetical protein
MLAALVLLLTGFLFADRSPQTPQNAANYGQVYFENSCAQPVQQALQRAIALLHSFEFGEAIGAFHTVEKDDPSCAIAAWGVALSNTGREGPDSPTPVLAAGWKELQPWLSRPYKTQREGLYIDAVSKLYAGYENTSGSERWRRYIAAMQQVRVKYPKDQDASMFYALALIWTADSGGTGNEQRREALKILLPLFEQNPKHPGAAHYIIHAADTPELATIALPASRQYATIAPAAPHALHMPSHIFSRLGYWQESLDSNISSAKVAAEWVAEGKDGLFDEQHALNHIEYAYLQMGRDHQAFEQIRVMQQLATAPGGDPWWPIDARIYYDLDTHNWSDALEIQAPASSPFIENIDVFWIHTIAAAHSNQAQKASAFLEDFRRSSSEFEKQHRWGDLIRLELLEAEAWTLFVQQDRAKAVETMKEAVEFEQVHPIYYPDVLPRPAAEMLGDMLLLVKSPEAALDSYRKALVMAPNRLNALIGARDAAANSQHPELAAQYKAILVSLCGDNVDRPEARTLLFGDH